MPRADDAKSSKELEATSLLALIAYFDVTVLIVSMFVIAFLCDTGSGAFEDRDSRLWLLHLPHAVIFVVALFVRLADRLYVPLFLVLLVGGTFVLDLFIVGIRISRIESLTEVCALLLLVSDVVFILLDIAYLASIARALNYYDLAGNFRDTESTSTETSAMLGDLLADPYIKKKYDAMQASVAQVL